MTPSATTAAPPVTTAALQAARFEAARQAPPAFDPREVRLSEAGQCPRRQTLRALGYPAAPPTDRELAVFAAGHHWEDALAALWEDRFPFGVQRQVPVVTPFGTGHIDLWVEPIRHLVEGKTTTEKHRADLPFASHVDQVTLYLHFFGQARGATAEIAYVIKETGEIVSCPVAYDADRAQELHFRLLVVQDAIRRGEPLPVPEEYEATRYPCAWHTPQGLARCGYWATCWGSRWQAAPDPAVLEAPALAADAAEYARLRQELQALDTQVAIRKARREQLERAFAQILDAHGARTLVAGGVRLTRTPVPGRPTWDVPAALAAGAVTAEALAPYRRDGRGYDRWSVREAPPAADARPEPAS